MGEIKRQRDKGTKGQRDKERCLPQPLPKGKGFVAALMHHHVFWGETKRQRDKESKRQRVKETKSQRDKERKRGSVGERKAKKN